MKVLKSLALAVLLAWPASTFAQGELGRVAGIVRDQSSAFAANVKVLVRNERTGEERTTVTSEQGYFLVGSLRPSTYLIRVEREGFAPIEYTAMPVAVGQELTLDF